MPTDRWNDGTFDAMPNAATSGRWNDAMLDAMRLKGDPPADQAIEAIFTGNQIKAAQSFMMRLMTNDSAPPSSLLPALKDFVDATSEPLIDLPRVELGERIFADHGPEILMILGCYALPEAYAASKGVKVLYRTGYLNHRPNRRLFRTMQMVVDVMTPGGLGPRGRGIRNAQKVRLMHAAIRYELLHDKVDKWDPTLGLPINQEDLAGTLITFSYLAVEGLRKLGVNITDDAAEAYLDSWRAVGRVMGICPELLPTDMAEARELKELIGRRQFAPSDEGRQMTQALLTMLEENATPLLKDVPAGLMRLFVPQEIADYLGVPKRAFDRELARIVAAVTGSIDREIQDSHWRAMVFRRYSLHFIQWTISVDAGREQNFFTLPTDLKQSWQVADDSSEETVWKHIADWVVSHL